MKKVLYFLLIAVLVLSLCACTKDTTVNGSELVSAEDVTKITILYMNDTDKPLRIYTNPEKIRLVTEHISSMTLDSSFPENPGHHDGGGYYITYTYKDGAEITFAWSGNMFFRVDDGAWYRMIYEEASAFSKLIYANPSD